jgi:hypothetical protein
MRRSGRSLRGLGCQTGRAHHEQLPSGRPSLIPDIEAFEERAAIAQYDGGLTRLQAENLAARKQGFATAGQYWRWLTAYASNRGLG